MLLDVFPGLLDRAMLRVFRQKRTSARAAGLMLGFLCSFGCRTVSRAICAVGRQHQDWSADYKLFSRSPWDPRKLFRPVLDHYLTRYSSGPIAVAVDATHLPRSGKKVPDAFWQRDPMSPPFHTNLIHGLRFVQTGLIFAHHAEGEYSARTIPIAFESAPAVKKPGARATEEEHEAYKQASKTCNLSQHGLNTIRLVRAQLDEAGAYLRDLVVAVDGSFCNRAVFSAQLERTALIARCRKDASLCFPAPEGKRRIYDPRKFTPEQVLHDVHIPFQTCTVSYGGKRREIRYKEVSNILWQRGAGRKKLRLIVIAPIGYQNSPNGRRMYHRPAFLLVTETDLDAAFLIQVYCDRWQIEVNHRDEKTIVGVGDGQVWSPLSVSRLPAFAVAAYSLLLLAGLIAFGPERTSDYLPLPKWRKRARRPSALDLITKLRDEINQNAGNREICDQIQQNTVRYAYT